MVLHNPGSQITTHNPQPAIIPSQTRPEHIIKMNKKSTNPAPTQNRATALGLFYNPGNEYASAEALDFLFTTDCIPKYLEVVERNSFSRHPSSTTSSSRYSVASTESSSRKSATSVDSQTDSEGRGSKSSYFSFPPFVSLAEELEITATTTGVVVVERGNGLGRDPRYLMIKA
ncbi:MAG: hypothetical protein M1831_001126 [Alyxoria varia]|nr:MAG: hypothetical protein M1831_001126 [Alyxoria varia]